ncbi:MAG: hypothetical protein ACJAWV_002753 [Flammeovirgaceae bacterium]|jgi:hypothetical protein
MAIKEYEESEMSFSFDESNLLLPEEADWQTRWEGVKVVDFIWKKSDKNLVIIEVKTSSPNFTSEKNQDNQSKYIQTLFEKFNASIHSLMGLTLDRSNYSRFEKHPVIHSLDTLKNEINIILIIKTAKDEWLPTIQDAINTTSLFQNICKSAGVKFSVLNPEKANKLLKMNITHK